MNRKIMALVAENASERKSSAAVKDVEDKTGSKPKESEYEKSNPATREPDYERYTQLREELKLELELQLSEILEEEDLMCLSELGVVSRDPAVRGGDENPMARSDGYEEPWDLEAAQVDIEDQFNGVLVGEWILRENPADNAAAASCSGAQPLVPAPSEAPDVPPPHELDVRTQTGYEKPWDWKPHLKDGRGPEGYEKPWDWKPHMKDDRPPKEYDEPWDKKAKNIENEVIAAKIAKEAVKAGGKDGAAAAAAAAAVASQVRAPEDAQKPHLKDGRPPNEYEEPWDKKAKDIESELIAAKIAKEAAKASAAGEPGPEQPSTSAGIGAAVKRSLKEDRLQLEKDAISNLQKSNQVLRTGTVSSAVLQFHLTLKMPHILWIYRQLKPSSCGSGSLRANER